MPLRQKLTAQALLLWRFLGFFQPPTLRLLHAVAAVLVILQFCTKLFGFGYGHVVLGLILCWVGFALVVWSLKTRGLRHYFPYLWGDMDQLKKDLAQLRGGKRIIAPRAKGLATVVQGLGLGALSMSLLSGLWMYVAWTTATPPLGPPPCTASLSGCCWAMCWATAAWLCPLLFLEKKYGPGSDGPQAENFFSRRAQGRTLGVKRSDRCSAVWDGTAAQSEKHLFSALLQQRHRNIASGMKDAAAAAVRNFPLPQLQSNRRLRCLRLTRSCRIPIYRTKPFFQTGLCLKAAISQSRQDFTDSSC